MDSSIIESRASTDIQASETTTWFAPSTPRRPARRRPARRDPPRVEVSVTPTSPLRKKWVDLHIEVLAQEERERREAYINVYVAELTSPGKPWTPDRPFTYPTLCTRPIPFLQVLRKLRSRSPYLGVLVSLCDPGHRELDWCCRVFQVSDGAEVLDRRRRR